MVETGGSLRGGVEGAEGEFGVEGARERVRSLMASLRALKLGRWNGSGSQQDLIMSYLSEKNVKTA